MSRKVNVVSKDEVTFAEALEALTAKKCTAIQAKEDSWPLELMNVSDLSYPVLCFSGTKAPMPAEYFIRPFFLVNEKPETIKKDIINVYLADPYGKIQSGPHAHGKVITVPDGYTLVNVAGVEIVPAPPKKKKVKHILTDVSWHKSQSIEKIERLGANGFIRFPFYPCGPKSGLISPLITTLGDKRCTLTIEYEE